MSSVWAQKLGYHLCPYMTRWILDLRIFSIRLHRFHRSDEDRHLHDRPWWFVSVLLWGTYREHTLGSVGPWRRLGSVAFRRALWRHAVELRPGRECWTLCITGPVRRPWGFWIGSTFLRGIDYFRRFGHPPCAGDIDSSSGGAQ